MRYSNKFYFVTPAGLVDIAEIPAGCGLLDAGVATADEWKRLIRPQARVFSFDPDTPRFCMTTVPAPWPGQRPVQPGNWSPPCGNQRRELEERLAPLVRQRLTLA
jgi:hypothetical protein